MSNGKHDPDCMEPVEDRIDILYRELELAIKWQRPSLLLAIYSTEAAHIEAETKLKDHLSRLGHLVHPLQNRTNDFGDYASQVGTFSNTEKTVFFADGFDWKCLQGQTHDHTTFEKSRDFFIKNKVRIVFWLTEANANALAHFAPDFWTFRHCSVEFIEMVELAELAAGFGTNQPSADQALSVTDSKLPDTGKETSIEVNTTENNQSEESNVNLLLTLGVLSWRKGDHEKAIEILESALKLSDQLQNDWNKVLCFTSLALVQTSMGKINEAIETYEQARPIAPPASFPWSNLGNLYNKVQRGEDAIASFQKAIEVDSRDAISWNGLGDVYLRIGRTEDAISAYQKAVEYAPEFACPWNGLGDGYKKQNNSDEALKAYLKAMEIDPKDAGIRIELGDLYSSLEKYDQAIYSYKQAIELDPGNGMAYSNLAVLHTRLGKYTEAVPFYQKSIELLNMDSDRTVLWDRLGDKFRNNNAPVQISSLSNEPDECDKPETVVNGNSSAKEDTSAGIETQIINPEISVQNPAAIQESSVNCEERSMEEKKDIPTPHLFSAAASADSYEVPHKPVEEEMSYPDPSQASAAQSPNPLSGELTAKTEKSNRIRFGWKIGNPFNFSAHSKRPSASKPAQNLVILDKGQALAGQIQSAEEIHTDRDASPLSESHQRKEINLLESNRGSDNLMADLPVEGDDMPAYSSADVHTEIDFINAQEWNEIGKVYFSLGDMEQAILTFNKAIEMNPKFGWPYSNMALAYTQQGRFEEAIFVYKKSIELFRDDKNKAIAWNRLGNVYLRMGNDDKAIAAYRMADQLDVENGVCEPSSGDLLPEFESYNAHVWNEVGRIYYNKNIYDKAIEAYQKAIAIDPGFGWSYSNLALAYSHQGRYAEAIPLHNKSIDLFRNDRDKAFSWNRLGDTYRRLNDHDNALAAYEMAVGLDPDNNSLLKRARFSLLSNCAAR